MIVQVGPHRFELRSRHTGRVLGTHPTRAAAARQEAAIHAHPHARGNPRGNPRGALAIAPDRPPSPTADDVTFWTYQSFDHTVLMAAGLADPGARAAAELQGRAWLALPADPPAAALLALLAPLEDLERALHRATAGPRRTWLGFSPPETYEHYREELVYFRALLRDGPPDDELARWADLLADHAGVVAVALDPPQAALREQGFALAAALCGGAGCRRGPAQLAALEEALARYVATARRAPTVLAPRLADHIARENAHFRAVLRRRYGAVAAAARASR